MRLSFVGLLGGGLATAIAFVIARTSGAGLAAAMGLAALFGAGVYLWAADDSKSWGDLGQGLLISVVVAIALLSVQHDADERSRQAELRRQRAAERQNLQLTLTLQRDLSNTSFRGRDLRGFSLSRKKLVGANLDRADLRRADLAVADMRRVSAVGTRFDYAWLVNADLRGALLSATLSDPERPVAASFRGAGLYRAQLAPGWSGTRQDLNYVDFRSADLTETVLRGATLRGADLRNADLADTDMGGYCLDRGKPLRGEEPSTRRPARRDVRRQDPLAPGFPPLEARSAQGTHGSRGDRAPGGT